MDGFSVKSRADGTVHSIKADGRTVAEVCVGQKNVRLNLRSTPKEGAEERHARREVEDVGWRRCDIAEGNLAACRALLSAAVDSAPAPHRRLRRQGCRRLLRPLRARLAR